MLTFDFLSREGREGFCISVESETLSTSKIEKNSKAEASGKGTRALCRESRRYRLSIEQRQLGCLFFWSGRGLRRIRRVIVAGGEPNVGGMLTLISQFTTWLFIFGCRLLPLAVLVI